MKLLGEWGAQKFHSLARSFRAGVPRGSGGAILTSTAVLRRRDPRAFVKKSSGPQACREQAKPMITMRPSAYHRLCVYKQRPAGRTLFSSLAIPLPPEGRCPVRTLAGIAIIGEEETTSGWLAPRAEETASLARSAASTLSPYLLYTVYILYYV